MRIRLNIAYDGSAFRGWQLQPDAPSVQGALEQALGNFHGGAAVRIMGSGRTDTGVHAVGQVAHYDMPSGRDPVQVQRAVNALLPEGVLVWHARQVDDDFHARFSARERCYAYRLLKRENIFLGRYGWHPNLPFDPAKTAEAGRLFLGKHDFRAFSTRPEDEDSTRCDLRGIEVEEDRDGWIVHLSADRYLRRMVRTIVGTMVEIGAGKLEAETVQTLLAGGSGRAGVPAPPQGLALMRVHYDIDELEDQPSPSPWGESA